MKSFALLASKSIGLRLLRFSSKKRKHLRELMFQEDLRVEIVPCGRRSDEEKLIGVAEAEALREIGCSQLETCCISQSYHLTCPSDWKWRSERLCHLNRTKRVPETLFAVLVSID